MIGIIANPSSGKDIRRLVAQGTVFDNMEKVNIVQRILSVIYASGLRDIHMMPDAFHISERASLNLKRSLKIDVYVKLLDIKFSDDQNDSTQAAELLCKMGASCIITLGGDGTNRAVAKACGDVPLITISTGTNNVFPLMLEGTMAGMAAVVAERDRERQYLVINRRKRINIYKNSKFIDIALIDVAITKDMFIGARALYHPEALHELAVTVAKPDCLGMSAIAGSVYPVGENDPHGLYLEMGEGGELETWVPMAPGMMQLIRFKHYRKIKINERIVVKADEGMVALDGEREVPFTKNDNIEIELSPFGPNVVNIHKSLTAASRGGFFIEKDGQGLTKAESYSFYMNNNKEE
ncbi:MAG: Acetoin catabolism protein X [Clostridiales bacterium 38_11]|nr:MAG: Acetoin catabolism protein X [Clostridiales bacterium 38_11]HBH12540.1 ATP-NAD kinase [Clostridiales bacterium]